MSISVQQSVTAFKADGTLNTRQYTTNPNGDCTDKYFGRTRRDFNIYQIKDLESSTCCISNGMMLVFVCQKLNHFPS